MVRGHQNKTVLVSFNPVKITIPSKPYLINVSVVLYLFDI